MNKDYLSQRTDRILLEEEIRQSHNLYQTIVETMNSGLLVQDEKGVITYVNQKLCEILGYHSDELTGKKTRTIIDPACLALFQKHIKTRKKNLSDAFEILCIGKDGTSIPIIMSALTIFSGSGQFIGSFAVITDITEMKHAEKLASLDSMTSVVAHELSQPLTVINLLLNETLDQLKKLPQNHQNILKNLEDCLSESENASAIISRLRRFTRGSSVKRHSNVNILKIARQLAAAMKRKADNSKIKLIVKDINIPAFKGNTAEIEQIFYILIQNAIEAADGEKWRKLTISAATINGTVRLSFTDNCRGIDPVNIENIFEPFFSTKKDQNCTGLGLSILKRILINCAGNVKVHSKPGKGTTFHITLPIDKKTGE